MFELLYYYQNRKNTSFQVKMGEDVTSVGSLETCSVRLNEDSKVQPMHCMIRWFSDHWEIYPFGECILNEKILNVQEWSSFPINGKCFLSDESYITVSRCIGTEELQSKKNSTTARRLKTNVASVTKEIPPPPQESNFNNPMSRYQIIQQIGIGGMGTVYEAYEAKLQRKVAIKILSLDDGDEVAKKRMLREAQIIAKLNHPHIVALHEMGDWNGRPFFAMDLLEGDNLSEMVKKGPVAPRKAAKWLFQIAQALHVAHRKGIIHRDLKPSNIMITSRGAILTDFGIAKDQSARTLLTVHGETLGTPAYMSPEQANGDLPLLNITSDTYSLGAIFYELLTGKCPFKGSAIEIIEQVCNDNPINVKLLNQNLPEEVYVITTKAMAKEQKYRYQTAKDFAKDLEKYLEGEAIEGQIPPWYSRLPIVYKSHRREMYYFVSAICVFLLLGFWSYYRDYNARIEKEDRVNELLDDAGKSYKAIANNKNLDLDAFIDASTAYDKVLKEEAFNPTALQKKFQITLRHAEYEIQKNNLEFAETLYFTAKSLVSTHSKDIDWEEEIADSEVFSDENIREVNQKTQELDFIKKLRKSQQIEQAEEILRLIQSEASDSELLGYAAIRLLKLDLALPELEKRFSEVDRTSSPSAMTVYKAKSYYSGEKGEDGSKNYLLGKLLPYRKDLPTNVIIKRLEDAESDEATQILCLKLLGLTSSSSVRTDIWRVVERSTSDKITQAALMALTMLDGGDNFILRQISLRGVSPEALDFHIKRRKRLLEKFKTLQQFSLPICLEILRRHEQTTKKFSWDPKAKKYFYETEPELLTEIFQSMGPIVAPYLLQMKKLDISEKRIVAKTLAKFPSNKSAAFFLGQLRENDEDITLTALTTLLKIFEENNIYETENAPQLPSRIRSIEEILNLIEIGSFPVQKKSIQLCGYITDASTHQKVLRGFRSALYKWEDQKDLDKWYSLAKEINAALERVGPEIVNLLESQVPKEDSRFRMVILGVLTKWKVIAERDLTSVLARYLYSQDPFIQKVLPISFPYLSASSLQQLFDKKTNNPSKDLFAKKRILEILNSIPGETSFYIYQKAVNHPNRSISKTAILGIALRGEKAIPTLKEVFLAGDQEDGMIAARSMPLLGNRLLDFALQSFENPEKFYRKEFGRLPEFKNRTRQRAAAALVVFGELSSPFLTSFLKRKQFLSAPTKAEDKRVFQMQALVIETLSKMKKLPRQDAETLVRKMKEDPFFPLVKKCILRDLRNQAVPALIRLYQGKTLVRYRENQILEILYEMNDLRTKSLFFSNVERGDSLRLSVNALVQMEVDLVPHLLEFLKDERKAKHAITCLSFLESASREKLKELLEQEYISRYYHKLPLVFVKYKENRLDNLRFLLETRIKKGAIRSLVKNIDDAISNNVKVFLGEIAILGNEYHNDLAAIIWSNPSDLNNNVENLVSYWMKKDFPSGIYLILKTLGKPSSKVTHPYLGIMLDKATTLITTRQLSHQGYSLLKIIRLDKVPSRDRNRNAQRLESKAERENDKKRQGSIRKLANQLRK